MIKKTLTFTNFDDVQVTQDYYFHLAKHELVDMQVGAPTGDFESYVKDLIRLEDNAEIIKVFKEIVTKSYGRRSSDGNSFLKDPDWTREFLGSAAFYEMIMEFFTNATAAAEFINGTFPKSLVEQARKEGLMQTVELPEQNVAFDGRKIDQGIDWDIDANVPAWVSEGRVPTKRELTAATPEQIAMAMGRKVGAENIRREGS